uniref:Uncharacterized protein n=1 Tax=Agrobacterium tumefaciens TaxID=358 RepID=A0A3S6ID85_AGRTU|nr:hypothetical protein AgrTiEU6_98 [Agrobacterium tumefaciens]
MEPPKVIVAFGLSEYAFSSHLEGANIKNGSCATPAPYVAGIRPVRKEYATA